MLPSQSCADPARQGVATVLATEATGIPRKVDDRRHAPVAGPEARPEAVEGAPVEPKVTQCRTPKRNADIESTRNARR